MRTFLILAVMLSFGEAALAQREAEVSPEVQEQAIRAATGQRAAAERLRPELTTELVSELPEGQPCVTYQYTPEPLADVSMDVLKQAEAALDIALLVLGETPESGESIDTTLLDKSQLLARHVAELCRAASCGAEEEEDEKE